MALARISALGCLFICHLPICKKDVDIKMFGLIHMQARFISMHQEEFQFVRTMFMKIRGSGEDNTTLNCLFILLLSPLSTISC